MALRDSSRKECLLSQIRVEVMTEPVEPQILETHVPPAVPAATAASDAAALLEVIRRILATQQEQNTTESGVAVSP